MPLIQITTSVAIAEPARMQLLGEVSKLAAKAIGKPESYVMVSMSQATMLMGGKPGSAAFCDVRSIGGLGGTVNATLSERLCALLGERLSIPADRVYLNFTDVDASNWGWNAQTFG